MAPLIASCLCSCQQQSLTAAAAGLASGSRLNATSSPRSRSSHGRSRSDHQAPQLRLALPQDGGRTPWQQQQQPKGNLRQHAVEHLMRSNVLGPNAGPNARGRQPLLVELPVELDPILGTRHHHRHRHRRHRQVATKAASSDFLLPLSSRGEEINLQDWWSEEEEDKAVDALRGKKPRGSVAGIDQSVLYDPSELKDPDSHFASFRGVKVHYKFTRANDKAQNSTSEKNQQILQQQHISGPSPKLPFPAIFLHGFGASLFSWEKFLQPFSDRFGSPAVAFDRPAFGLTARPKPADDLDLFLNPETNPYSLLFSSRLALAFIGRVGKWDQTVLVGHSAGCLTALEAYFLSPSNVAALVLIAPAVFPPSKNQLATPNSFARPSSKEESRSSGGSTDDVSSNPLHPSNSQQLPLREPEADKKKTTAAQLIGRLLEALAFSLVLIFVQVLSVLYKLPETICKMVLSSSRKVRILITSYGHQLLKSVPALLPVWRGWTVAAAAVTLAAALLALACLLVVKNMCKAIRVLCMGWRATSACLAAFLLRTDAARSVVRTAMDKAGVQGVRMAWHDKSAITQDIIKGYTKPLGCRDWDRALLEYVIAMSLNSDISARLHEVQCPVLVIGGKNDAIVPAWNAKKVAQSFPNARYEMIEDCGHLPHEERPEKVLKAMDDFFATKVFLNVTITQSS